MKKQILLTILFLISILTSKAQYGGFITVSSNSIDSTYTTYAQNSPTNTYGNRWDIIKISKKKYWLRTRQLYLDSFLIGRTIFTPTHILGYDSITKEMVPFKLLPYSKLSGTPTDLSNFTNGPGYITGVTSSMVTSALGYIPYNGSTNPSGFLIAESDPLFNTKFATKTTTDLIEGSKLYYTDNRSRSAISLTTTGSSGLATYNSATGALNIPNYTPSITSRKDTIITRAINGTAFQPSALSIFTNQDVQVNYSINISLVSVLAGNATGTVYLEKSINGSTGWINVSQSSFSVSGLVSTTSNTQTVSGFINKNYYVRIRTVSSTTGIGSTVTFTYQTGQENSY